MINLDWRARHAKPFFPQPFMAAGSATTNDENTRLTPRFMPQLTRPLRAGHVVGDR